MSTYYHTSPNKITKISKVGRYGSFLCFSENEYVMTGKDKYITYKIEIDENELINASSLFYHEKAHLLERIVEEASDWLGEPKDTVRDLIEETISVYDIDGHDVEDLADLDWDIQYYTARCARVLGYRGVISSDEQGVCYMIDMLGMEKQLEIIK